MLDLVLTNEENMVNNLSYNPGLGKSDHLALSFEYLCFTSSEPEVSFKTFNCFKGDYSAISKWL